MSISTTNFEVPRPVVRKLATLRLLVRLYVWLEGLAAVLVVVGAAFWIGLAIDWTWEPSPAVRVALWIVVAGVVAVVVVRLLLVRIWARLSNSSIALLIERQFPHLRESLITTIEAGAKPQGWEPFQVGLLQQTSRRTVEALGDVRLSRMFQYEPLLWKAGAAALLFIPLVVFALWQQEAFGFWVQRMRLSPEPWPRTVQLSIEGFAEHEGVPTVYVARGDDVELNVLASIVGGHLAPPQVEIRYRLADGRRGRDSMTKVGEALPGRDQAQRFHYQFKQVAADLRFDVVGGDDRLRDLRLKVVERPQIMRTILECEYPEYLHRSPRTLEVSGRVELPTGTWARCWVTSTKPLQQATVIDAIEQVELPTTMTEERPNEFSFALAANQDDRVLQLTLLDQDGVENREPYRVVVSVLNDEPPEVAVQLRGIGSAVTPQATIPFAGRITDQYGIEQVWFRFYVDQADAQRRVFRSQPEGARELSNLQRFDLAETDPDTNRPLVEVRPGEKLTLSLHASDAYDLGNEPNIGSSQRFVLNVVTPAELRSLLQHRELGLRQRFESIYEKMLGTRELLDRIGLAAESAESETDPAGQPIATEEIERRQQRDQLRISGAHQNATQLAHETLGVAEGFSNIVAELENNRIASEELKQRLGGGIADPLREIAQQQLPEMETILERASAEFDGAGGAATSLQAAKVQSDVVLEAMQQVLDRMLELESYNELVELLQTIVRDQQQLNENTKQQRRQQLRELLDE